MQRHLIHQQAQQGECGIKPPHTPQFSNHGSVLAIDIEDPGGWRPISSTAGNGSEPGTPCTSTTPREAWTWATRRCWRFNSSGTSTTQASLRTEFDQPPQPPLNAHQQTVFPPRHEYRFWAKDYWDRAATRVCVWGAGQRFLRQHAAGLPPASSFASPKAKAMRCSSLSWGTRSAPKTSAQSNRQAKHWRRKRRQHHHPVLRPGSAQAPANQPRSDRSDLDARGA